jgi:hypothetical protein
MNKKHLYLSLIILISLIFSFNSLKAISFPRSRETPPSSSSSLTYNLSLVFKEVNKDTIEIGPDDNGYATLEWELSGFDRLRKVTLSNDSYYCKASGDWSGEKQISGEEKVNYSKEEKTFFLSCYKKDDPSNPVASASAKIEVLKATLTADPSIIIQGETVTLKYSLYSFNAPSLPLPSIPTTRPIPSIPTTKPRLPSAIFDLGNPSNPSVPTAKPSSKETYSCTLNEKVVTLSSTNSGESTERPSDDTTYTFKCSWQDKLGNHSSSATTTVKVAKLNFDIYPTEYYKETTTLPVEVLLGWESRYFDKCEASSDPNVWQGQKSLTGQETAKVNGTTSFTLTCSGINGDYSRKKSITKKIEEKSLFSFPVWLIANPSQVYQGEEIIVSWGISGSFDSCSLSLKPLCEILGYSNDTSAVNKCNRGSQYYPKIDPECFKNIQHIWDTTKFTLSPREKAKYQQDPDYSKSFNIGSRGYGSIKIKPDKDTVVSIKCQRAPVVWSEEKKVLRKGCIVPMINDIPIYDANLQDVNGFAIIDSSYYNKGDCGQISGLMPGKDAPIIEKIYGKPKTFEEAHQLVASAGWKYTGVYAPTVVREESVFTLKVLSSGSTGSASIIIKVLSSTDLQVSLSANPTQIKKGGETTLTYSAINAKPDSNCIATSTDSVWKKDIKVGSDGKVSGSDKVTLNEVKTYEFNFTCYDKDNKSKTATAKVEVTSEECLYPDKIPHNICQGGKCISSSTCGKDECREDSDCSPPLPTCNVTIEAKPNVIFLGNSLNLEWWPNNCNECEATTTPSIGGGNWSGNPLNLETTAPPSPLNIKHTTKVTPTQKGEYIYQITCDDNTVWDTAEVKVKVIPVPFWREIIPVLPGFLRGLFRR